MRRQLLPSLMMTIAMIVITGLLYPFAVWGVGRIAFNDRAGGSFVAKDGKIVGSSLIGQNFTDPKYFQPRPSAAGADGYDGLASAGTNLGPSNPKLLQAVQDRVAAYRELNGLGPNDEVPVDAVTASSSGLDPQISLANARLQAERVGAARGLSVGEVLAAIARHTQDRQWGFLGEKGVNVLELNLDLDRLRP
jgi:potassium-transporting ATPase KdpC subunit